MNRFKLFIPLFIFAIVAGFFYITVSRIGEGEYNPQNLPSALLNKPFPEFTLPTLEGEPPVADRSILQGQIALVNVWATWCPSCHAEHQYLNQLVAQQGIVIIGVNYKDDQAAALQWLAQKGNPYRLNLFDAVGKLGLDLGVTGAPETYVIDHRGFVRLRFQGPLDERVWREKFQALMQQLREEQAADLGRQTG